MSFVTRDSKLLGRKKSYGPNPRKASVKGFKDILRSTGESELELVERPKLRPTTKYINVFVKCSNLVNLDVFSLSDPMVSLFIKDDSQYQFIELDRTETCKDTLDPEFNMSLFVNSIQSVFSHQIGQKVAPPEIKDEKGLIHKNYAKNLRLVVVDIDDDSSGIGTDNLIGCLDWNIHELLKSKDLTMNRELVLDGRFRGSISLFGEYINEACAGCMVHLSIGAINIPKMDIFSNTDAYFVVKRRLKTPTEHLRGGNNGPMWHNIYTSEVKSNAKNAIFQTISQPLNHWCNGDLDHELIFEFYDYNDTSLKKYIGEVSITTRQLLEAQEKTDTKNREFQIIKKRGRGRTMDRGKLILFSLKFDPLDIKNVLDQQKANYELNVKKWNKDIVMEIGKDVEVELVEEEKK